jgi:hypothetical protein
MGVESPVLRSTLTALVQSRNGNSCVPSLIYCGLCDGSRVICSPERLTCSAMRPTIRPGFMAGSYRANYQLSRARLSTERFRDSNPADYSLVSGSHQALRECLCGTSTSSLTLGNKPSILSSWSLYQHRGRERSARALFRTDLKE